MKTLFGAFLLATSWVCAAQSDIEQMGVPYTETLNDTTATLTYWPTATGTDLIFKMGGASSLELQCRLLDVLLTRVLRDHPAEARFSVTLGSVNDSLMPELQRYLLTSPGWDSKRGRPRDGRRLGAFLTEAINKSGALAPIAKVFVRHGFAFKLAGLSRIDIQAIPAMHGARLPLYIWQMNFAAVKK